MSSSSSSGSSNKPNQNKQQWPGPSSRKAKTKAETARTELGRKKKQNNTKGDAKNIIKPAKIFAAGIEKCCAIKIAFLC